MAAVLHIRSHGDIPVSNFATYLGIIDRSYVRFGAVEAVSEDALERRQSLEVLADLAWYADDLAQSARRARRYIAVEDRLRLVAIRLSSPGEIEAAAGAAKAAKATAGVLEQAITLKQ